MGFVLILFPSGWELWSRELKAKFKILLPQLVNLVNARTLAIQEKEIERSTLARLKDIFDENRGTKRFN